MSEPRWRQRWRRLLLRSTATGVVLLTTLATLVVAFGLKSPCLPAWEPKHQPKSCYNDIQTLWNDRDMAAKEFPYSGAVQITRHDGHVTHVQLGAGQIEYPVLTGVFAWVTALPVHGPAGYLILSALALTPFALVSALALARLAGTRYLLFAVSPQLAAYAFLNWDLLPVASVVLAAWARRRDRVVWAGVLLGLGASAKLWPGFVLLPLLLELLVARRFRAAAAGLAAAVATVLVVNLPFVLHDVRGWSAPFLMQSTRTNDATTNSIWSGLWYHADLRVLNLVSAAAVLAGWALTWVWGARTARRTGRYPWLPVAGAMVCLYIVLGRVDSPQYGLWLLPFVVLVGVRARYVAAFMASDLLLWLVWSFLYGTPHWVHVTAQVLRGLGLLLLAWGLLRAPDQAEEPERLSRASTAAHTPPVIHGATN